MNERVSDGREGLTEDRSLMVGIALTLSYFNNKQIKYHYIVHCSKFCCLLREDPRDHSEINYFLFF